MHRLPHIQKSFYQAVFEKSLSQLDFISSPFAQERFDVYRQTIFENMRNALKITFPGIWKLLGDACADGVASIFFKLEKNLPCTGCLDDFGESFPSFLAHLKDLSSLPYLRDYATYEWLKHKAYGARECASIQPIALQSIPEEQIEDVIFSFIPSCFMFTSQFPIPDIQEVVENCEAESIDLAHASSYGVIARPEDEVLTFWVSKELWSFINYLTQNFSLAESNYQTQKSAPDFSLVKAIHFLLQKQLIHKVIFPGDNHHD